MLPTGGSDTVLGPLRKFAPLIITAIGLLGVAVASGFGVLVGGCGVFVIAAVGGGGTGVDCCDG